MNHVAPVNPIVIINTFDSNVIINCVAPIYPIDSNVIINCVAPIYPIIVINTFDSYVI